MDPHCIKAFVTSIRNVFHTMLKLDVAIGTPECKNTPVASYDISGIIGMSGDVSGLVVISFPTATAERVVAALIGAPMSANHPDFADAIGELVNMVSGGAKALFGGANAAITCPSVISGPNHVVRTPRDTPCIAIPCTTTCGVFMIEVAIRFSKPGQVGAASAPAA